VNVIEEKPNKRRQLFHPGGSETKPLEGYQKEKRAHVYVNPNTTEA